MARRVPAPNNPPTSEEAAHMEVYGVLISIALTFTVSTVQLKTKLLKRTTSCKKYINLDAQRTH
jgi:hypothetical protein